jgi:CBS domain-containing protein
MTSAPLTCAPQQTLRAVLALIGDADVEQLPVVDPARPGEVRGMLGRGQILWAVGEMASEHARLFDRMDGVGPTRDGAVEVIVEVTHDHAELCFRRLRELRLPGGCLVATLRRAGAVTVPNGDTVVEPGDALALVTTRENESTVREWVRGLDRR